MNLLERVRETQTLDGGVKLYRDAAIQLLSVAAREMKPTALYVMNPSLRWLLDAEILFAKNGLDLFNLNDVYVVDGITMGPPVVEWMNDNLGIVDGIHRMWIAQRESMNMTAVAVCGASIPFVFETNEWNQVKQYESKPQHPHQLRRIKQGYADEPGTLRRHFRDFGYLGSRGRRPREGQNG